MECPFANVNEPINPQSRDYYLVPVDSERYSRAQRSVLQSFDDPNLQSVPEYKYKPLSPLKKRIRLLQLRSGTFHGPDIFCELVEADYGNPFHIPTKPMDDTKAHATINNTVSNSSKESEGTQKKLKLTKEQQQEQRRKLLEEECKRVRDNESKYEALSWCWGAGSADCAICIIEKNPTTGKEETFKKRVRRDLALALKYLRKPNETRTLWIDAICIDQDNHVERNQQVQMMSRIYTRASEVCIWLGEDTPESKMAIEFIRKEITQLNNFDTISLDKRYSAKWQALMVLMQRDWFSRRWVVQEIALANKATIHCGPDSIPWKEFAVAVELFVEVETATHRLSEIMQKDEKFRHIPGWFEYVSELGASLLVQATGKVFRAQRTPLDDSGDDLNDPKKMAEFIDTVHTIDPLDRRSLLSLEYLVTTMFTFKASEYRDCVYSMLAIARDATPSAATSVASEDNSILTMSMFDTFLAEKPFPVNYARPYVDVCRDFVEFCIRRKKKLDPVQALDILCRPWALEPPEGTSIRLPVTSKNESDLKKNRKRILPIRTEPWQKRKCLIEVTLTEKNSKDGRENTRTLYTMFLFIFEVVLRCFVAVSRIFSRKRETMSDSETCKRFRYVKTDQDKWVDDKRNMKEYKEWIHKNWDGKSDADAGDKRKIWKRGNGWDLVEELVDYHRKQMGTNGKDTEPAKGSVQGQDHVENSGRYQKMREKIMKGQANVDLNLPSWVARACKAPFSLYKHPGMHILKTGRVNADPLVGPPKDGHRNYSAAQTEAVRLFKFRKRPSMGHYSLYVEGVELDRVVEVKDASQGGNIPKSWLQLGGWEEPYSKDPPAKFWRTIVADRGQDNRNPPYYYARACKESVLKGGTASGRVNTSDLIDHERNSIIAEFCRRVHAVVWGRSLFKTESGNLGLATNVSPGDRICILYGCTVPVILERHTKGDEEKALEDAEDHFEAFKSLMRKTEKLCERRARYRSQTEENQSEEQQQEAQSDGADEAPTEGGGSSEELERRNNALKRKKKREIQQATKLINDILESEETKRRNNADNERKAEERKEELDELYRKAMSGDTSNDDEPEESELQRKMRKAKEEDPKLYYVFKGESYVHGLMDGEALREKFYKDFPNRTFELR